MEESDYRICPKCKGSGRFEHSISQNKIRYFEEGYCNKCNGNGKLDWLDYILPAKPYDLEHVFDDFYGYDDYDYYPDDYYNPYDELPYWDEFEIKKNKKRRKGNKCLRKRPM